MTAAESGAEAIPAHTIVVGIGNPYRGDDGVGVAVARLLADLNRDDVCIITAAGEGITLLERWTPRTRVFLVDAARSGHAPGTVHRFDATREPLPTAMFGWCSTHAFGIAGAIELARSMGRLPREMIVYGIEAGTFRSGVGLSPAVQQAAHAVAARIRAEVTGRNHETLATGNRDA